MKKRWTLLLALVWLTSCRQQIPAEIPQTTEIPETVAAAEDTTEQETTLPDTKEPETSFAAETEIPSLTAEADQAYSFPFDGANDVYILYDLRRENDRTEKANIRVQIYDETSGAYSVILPIEGNAAPSSISFTEDGFVLYAFVYGESGPEDVSAWKVTWGEDGYSIEPTEYDVTVQRGREVTSPDGKWSAYDLTTDLWGNGGVMLRDEQGEARLIAENVMLTEENPIGIGEVRGYEVIGFLDDTHLVYRIGGWEWTVGFGIYDVESGETREIANGCSIQGIHDGALYGVKTQNYAPAGVYRIDSDGAETLLADGESTKGMLQEMMFREGNWYEMRGGLWLVIPSTGDKPVRGLIFSADFSEVIADVTGTDLRQIYEEYYQRTDR